MRHSRSSPSTRLFDPSLTASALDEIRWLPRFRESISRVSGKAGKSAGAFDTSSWSGTRRLRKTTKLPETVRCMRVYVLCVLSRDSLVVPMWLP